MTTAGTDGADASRLGPGPLPHDGQADRGANGDHGLEVHTHRTVRADQYGQFLIEVFEEWARHDVGDVFVQAFDTALAPWMGMDPAGLFVHARTCGSALALEHNGDVYSCDHYVEEGDRVGNLAEGRTLLQLATSRTRPRSGGRSSTRFPTTA